DEHGSRLAEKIQRARGPGWRGVTAVLEGEESQVRLEADCRGSAKFGSRSPGHVYAVVVESEPGDRGRVPPVWAVELPRVMNQLGFEVTSIAHQRPGHLLNAAGHQAIRQRVDPGPHRVAARGSERVDSIAMSGKCGISASIDHQVAPQDAVLK